jgi:UDP-3-O-[3-hydroxymyristoyl] glucosamine N-acyltransferase
VLYDGVELGREVIIHSGSVIGADGFGYKFRDGRHLKVPQVGSVRIGDGVEIGANSCVDRAALGSTLVGEGTKIDNFVQIAHNVRVGRHVILCGQAAAAGSCAIEDYAVLGARAGLADHARVGQGARIAAAAGISGDVPPRATFLGYWAQDRRAALRELAAVRKLPDLLERLHRLELRVRELEGSGPPLLRERK